MIQDDINPEELLLEGGIPRNLVYSSKLEIDHFLCPICLNIIWKPVACGQDRCFQSFCESCIYRWVNSKRPQPIMGEDYVKRESLNEQMQSNSSTPQISIERDSSDSEIEMESVDQEWQEDNMSVERVQPAKCPKCKRTFKQTSIPIIHNLLEAIEFNCVHQGCNDKPKYEQFYKHIINCEFRKTKCNGCHQVFQLSELTKHQSICEFVLVKCKQCISSMTRRDLLEHPKDQCIQRQFEDKDFQIQRLQDQLNYQKVKVGQLEQRIEKLSRGDFDNIVDFTFKTSFSSNYLFSQGQVKLLRFGSFVQSIIILQRNSYNPSKQKNDFLHFYLNVRMKTQSLVGQQWKLKVNRLQGHLLLGICSSLCHHSIDFIINRLGEVKKKESNENKYKQMRKVNFTFTEGDVLLYQFLPFQQQLRILNESKHLVCRFECSEMVEMGDTFYCFFSLEQAGDQLQFL